MCMATFLLQVAILCILSYLGFELDKIISAFLINYELKSNWDFFW